MSFRAVFPTFKIRSILSRNLVAVVAGAACLFVALCVARADTIQLVEKPWDALPNHDVGDEGTLALSIRPAAWLHGETPNWILHYRRITEAKRVALEIDYHLAFISKTLDATAAQTAHKAHVFIFEDERDWKEFMSQVTRISPVSPWAVSFAHGENLFLNVRNGNTGMFDSQTLAHETTHAVVARIYPHDRPPLWLSEGFAEEMSGRSTAARMGQYNPRLLQRFQVATMPLAQLTALTAYPADLPAVAQLYQSSEKLVRFLMTDAPVDRFPRFFEAMLKGADFSATVMQIYGDKYPTYDAFVQRYTRLAR